jgi:hypothetical protein
MQPLPGPVDMAMDLSKSWEMDESEKTNNKQTTSTTNNNQKEATFNPFVRKQTKPIKPAGRSRRRSLSIDDVGQYI